MTRMVFEFKTATATLRLRVMAQSRVRLEWAQGSVAKHQEFEVLEDALVFVTVHPEEFNADLYAAFLRYFELVGF